MIAADMTSAKILIPKTKIQISLYIMALYSGDKIRFVFLSQDRM